MKRNVLKDGLEVFASDFEIIHDPDITLEDKADFTKGLFEYSKGNFDFEASSEKVAAALNKIKKHNTPNV